MTLDAAASLMQGQNLREVSSRMTVGAGLGIGLAKVGGRVDLHCVVNRAAGSAMIVASEVGAVAANAFATAGHGRRDQSAVASRVVAGGTAAGRMNLANPNEWRVDGGMAADTVGRGRGGCQVFLDLVGVIVIVVVEIARVAIGAGAAIAAIYRGITVAVGTGPSGAVGAGVAEEAIIVVDAADGVAGVAVDAECSGRNSGGMIVTMRAGKVIDPMAADTL